MWKKAVFKIIFTAVGFVMGLITCAMLTPVLWKLEPVLGLELAGHSGPVDWLLITCGAIFAAIGFALSFKI